MGVARPGRGCKSAAFGCEDLRRQHLCRRLRAEHRLWTCCHLRHHRGHQCHLQRQRRQSLLHRLSLGQMPRDPAGTRTRTWRLCGNGRLLRRCCSGHAAPPRPRCRIFGTFPALAETSGSEGSLCHRHQSHLPSTTQDQSQRHRRTSTQRGAGTKPTSRSFGIVWRAGTGLSRAPGSHQFQRGELHLLTLGTSQELSLLWWIRREPGPGTAASTRFLHG